MVITVFFLGIAFLVALLSSVAADQRNTQLATIAAAVSLVLALLGALYIIPRLARNVRLEILRFAIRTTVTVEGLLFIVFLIVIGFAAWNTGNNLLYLILSAMLAFLMTVAVAFLDEWHQTSMPSRNGEVKDVVLDSAGAAAAQCLILVILKD